jgi:hypothetical protein
VVAQGGSDVCSSGQAQHGDHKVAQAGHDPRPSRGAGPKACRDLACHRRNDFADALGTLALAGSATAAITVPNAYQGKNALIAFPRASPPHSLPLTEAAGRSHGPGLYLWTLLLALSFTPGRCELFLRPCAAPLVGV